MANDGEGPVWISVWWKHMVVLHGEVEKVWHVVVDPKFGHARDRGTPSSLAKLIPLPSLQVAGVENVDG
jgi:hypothetical protein